MRLKHIEAFNALMLTGTVSGAAKLLHVTQPAVSQTIQHAELQLGYPLFARQRRRLVPTREALELYPEVQRLMTQLEEVRRLASGLKSGGAGQELRIQIVPSLAVRLLPDALSIFRRRYPKVALSVRIQHSNEIARAIALHEADIGIVYGSLTHANLEEELVASGHLVYVSKVRQPGSECRTTIALKDVLREPFIRIDEQDPLGAMLADQWSRMELAPAAGISVQTHHIAMLFAEQGFGPAIIDSFTAKASRCDTLHVRTLLPEIPVDVRALIPRGTRSQKRIADLIAAMRDAAQLS
ncbi:LysR family transcriptional regulator [Xanthomonas euvesicatoria]|uniref:LysR family transcriptional regulator n=1 Tax=Xanthomonas euvesicatoria TaxID=456327 RepID=UPI001C44A39D|nr:LysR family transcriptional regulator [Xanthomonas euvesicatoria]MBV6791636.1 LysR family transcriptional regulator [Xanthomonas campestris pv. clerodendri]